MRTVLFVLLFTLAIAQYVPEKYGWACYNVAAKRNWNQCANTPKALRKSCLCTIPEFVSMTESCLLEAVKNDTDPDTAMVFAHKLSMCRIPDNNEKNDFLKPFKNKSPSPGSEKLLEYQYIDPILEDELRAAISTGEWRMSNDKISVNSGLALIGFWVSLLFIRYMSDLLMRWIPLKLYGRIVTFKPIKFARARILNPPLFQKHHSQPLEKFLGIHIPTRAFSITILLFLVLNYCLIFTNYPHEPNNFMFTTPRQQWSKSLAIRTAFMTMWKLPLIFCFAGRNNFFLLIGHPWSMNTFNTFHRWIARVTIVDIIIHGVAISIVKADQGLYNFIWNVPYWRWGIVGIIISILFLFHSIRWFVRKNYELFKVIHISLAVIFIVSAYYHVKILPYGTKHIYSIVAIWSFDYLVRIVRILLAQKSTATIEHINSSLSLIRICAPRFYTRAMKHESQYLFLHVQPWYKFWQSHPFTIVHDWQNIKADSQLSTCSKQTEDRSLSTQLSSKQDSNADIKGSFDENLVVAIQHRGGITNTIARLPEGKIQVALDGPYRSYYPLSRFHKIVFIAGGIGITAHVGYIQLLLSKQIERSSEIKLHWAVRNFGDMEWLMDAIAYLSFRIEVTIYFQNPSDISKWCNFPIEFKNSRLCCNTIVTEELKNERTNGNEESIAFFSCGPGSLNDDARVAVCWGIEKSNSYVDYFEESFGS